MTRKQHPKRKVGRLRTGRRLKVWAEYRDPVDIDRFVAVLVTLALRRIEEEANQTEADDG
jgi:hypothetical protein